MPLDAAQIAWLSQATKVKLKPPVLPGSTQVDDQAPVDGQPSAKDLEAALREKLEQEAVTDEQRKQLALADAMRTIKPLKPVLREAFNLQVTGQGGTTQQFQPKSGDVGETAESTELGGKQRISKGGSVVPSKEERSQENTASQGGDLVDEARRAYNLILTLRSQLEGMTTTRSQIKPDGTLFDGAPEPLFVESEIVEELFTPLVREKILPDTFITGKYSAVQKMLDGSTALYKEELKEAGPEQSSTPAMLKMAVDVGGKMTTAILKAAGADTKMATTLLEGATSLAKLSIDFGGKVAKGIDVKSVTDLLEGLPEVVGSMVGAAFQNKELGELVGAAGSAGAAGINTIILSIKDGKPAPDELVKLVSSLISVGMQKIESSNDKEKAGITFGNDIQKLLASASSAHATKFFDCLLAGDPKKARQEMFGVIKEVVVGLPSLAADTKDLATASDTELTHEDYNAKASKEDQAIEKGEKNYEKVKTSVETALEKREEMEKKLKQMDQVGSKKLEELGENVDKAAEDRKKLEADPEAFSKDVASKLKEEQEAFKKELAGLGDRTADDKAIEKLMANIQRDRSIMSVAVAIGNGGFEVASKFFAPLSVGTEVIKMSMNIAAAVQRAVDLRKFLETQQQSRNAVSPYITSIQNFVDNQKNQLTEYSIRIALNGVNIAASVAATAFPLAAPFVPLAAGIQGGTEILFETYNEGRLKSAWTVTKQAMDNPTNRKLGLRARKLNPTLAKYTIAYGAEIARDPIALQMCQACGLSMETVKTADAKKVKDYLELRFDKDGVVAKTYVDPTDWMSDLPEPDAFTPAVVFATYSALQDAKDKKLLTGTISGDLKPPPEVTTMIRFVAQPLSTPAVAEELEEHLAVLGRIAGAFNAEGQRLAPLGDGVAETLTAFAGIADVKQQAMVLQLLKVKQAQVTI